MLAFIARVEPSSQELLDQDTKRLVIRFQEGEREVFDEIYLRHYGAIYGYAHSTLRSSHDSEDAAQQVFVRAFLALADYEIRGAPFRAWLTVIARNIINDSLRMSQRVLVEDPTELRARQEVIGAQRESDLDWLSRREVAHHVGRLPDSQREVVVLRHLLDLSYDQIAARIGASAQAAEHLHSRAIRVLEGRLAAGPVPA